jgi:hypothetical protein
LLVVPGAYPEPHSPLYITQEEWAAMWPRALGADGKRIIDIRVTENYGEVAKYVTKPGGYLELTGEQWQCDDRVLETLHYGLASRRMIPVSTPRPAQPSTRNISKMLTDEIPASLSVCPCEMYRAPTLDEADHLGNYILWGNRIIMCT